MISSATILDRFDIDFTMDKLAEATQRKCQAVKIYSVLGYPQIEYLYERSDPYTGEVEIWKVETNPKGYSEQYHCRWYQDWESKETLE